MQLLVGGENPTVLLVGLHSGPAWLGEGLRLARRPLLTPEQRKLAIERERLKLERERLELQQAKKKAADPGWCGVFAALGCGVMALLVIISLIIGAIDAIF